MEIFWESLWPLHWRLTSCDDISYFACSPETLGWIFFSCLPGNLALKKGRDFWVNFFWSPFPTKRSTKTPQKIGGKFGAKFGEKFGTEIWKIRGTFVLQLFWPKYKTMTCPCSLWTVTTLHVGPDLPRAYMLTLKTETLSKASFGRFEHLNMIRPWTVNDGVCLSSPEGESSFSESNKAQIGI